MIPIQEHHPQLGCDQTAPITDDTIVISGMSSLMPGCFNLKEFSEKLYNKENLINRDRPRWVCKHPELSPYYGKVPDINRFDAQFFMVHYKLSQSTDAISRKLLEQAYQAIFDAGVCPTELSGKRVGVFVSTGLCETEKLCSFTGVNSGILGCNRTMFANRISYWLDSKGPSYSVDASCCGSIVALEKAYESIMRGECEAAIVGAARITMHPQASIHYQRIVPLNQDGKTKCYDINADGQAMSEAVNVIFLQKYKNARRVYAELCYVKTQFAEGLSSDFKNRYSPYREPARLAKFLRCFYEEAQVSPSSVEYIEGFGSALPQTDKAELQTIEEVFCKKRSRPLLVGSVASNMGYTETASGTCAIIKILLAYQKGELAANLHCNNPRQDIGALRDGRMKIVTEHQRFQGSYAAVNSFSITGMNGHVLLKGHHKEMNTSSHFSNIPYLVTASGRQESGVQKILDGLKGNSFDPDEIALLHNIHRLRISKHLARGYGIYTMNNNETVMVREDVDYYDDAKRPLWFVYSGMGSQWAGMGTQLMRIPIFAAAIERCHKVLEPQGIDIVQIITSTDGTIFDNILNSFVGIAAIQIGLTDVLRAVGLVPDKMIGHSVGELGCAYADGCCTAEEMIMLSYSRGLVSLQIPFIRGSMAAVGIGYKQISKLCPPEIDVACHNSTDSSTISGQAEAMKKFVAKLKDEGTFAKEVRCSNIAYHSRYIAIAAPELLRNLSKIIKVPKTRSERWLSTSISQDKWSQDVAKYSSAEYHTNNFLNPVLFEETCRLIPSNAVVVEVAPHGLLQAILKRSLPETCTNLALTRRGHTDSALFLLETLGKLYMKGYDLDISALYPKISFPVSTKTRQLSHLVEWVHTEQWNLCQYVSPDRLHTAVYEPIITIYDEEYKFLTEHIIEEKRVFPFAGALVFAWDTLAMSIGKRVRELTVQFHDVQLHKQPILYDSCPLHLVIALQRGSGRFEVTYNGCMVVEGYITASTPIDIDANPSPEAEEPMDLLCSDVYKLLYERGYEYGEDFRSIHSANMNITKALITWQDNWVTFIDGVIQFNALRQEHNAISQPEHIKRISINIGKHFIGKSIEMEEESYLIKANYSTLKNTTRCGGLTIEQISFKDKPSSSPKSVALKTLQLVPFIQEENNNVLTNLYVFLQIVAENFNRRNIKILYVDNTDKESVFDKISHLLNSCPRIKLDVKRLKEDDIINDIVDFEKPDIVLLNNPLHRNKDTLSALYETFSTDTYILSLGAQTHALCAKFFKPICIAGKGHDKIELAVRKSKLLLTNTVSIRSHDDLELLIANRKNIPSNQKLVIITSYPPLPGLKEVVQELREGGNRDRICLAMVNEEVKDDNLGCVSEVNLAYNVLDQNKWCGEYYVPMNETSVTSQEMALYSKRFGDLDSLQWVEVPKISSSESITVYYSGLNVYDAKRALAEIPTKVTSNTYGIDFSGIAESGDRVMGLVPEGTASGQIRLQSELLWPVPGHWSLEDAATVPLPYCLAFYCLGIKAKLIPGMTILVHGGAGALGQAAISIALANGCKVFTTVSDRYKKKFLKQLYPEIPVDHIGNSRDVTFKDMILNATKGNGCDIVISSVKGDLKNATLACCAPSGVSFDFVQINTRENFKYGMFYMTQARSYVPIDFVSIFSKESYNNVEIQKLRFMMSEGIALGYVRPLTRVTFAPHEVSRAFRLLAASRHRGRVLLNLLDSRPLIQPILAVSPEHCYLFICDSNCFELLLADRLISLGARKLYIHCSQPSAYLQFKQRYWQKLGVNVAISSEDLSGSENVHTLLKNSNYLGPVAGIYIISSNTHNKKSESKFISTIKMFDLASRTLCTKLRYFTILCEDHSIAHDVCVNRHQCGLHTLAVQMKLKKFDQTGTADENDDIAVPWKEAVDLIEEALNSNEHSILAYLKLEPKLDLLNEVSQIPGVRITNETYGGTTLDKVGIDYGRAQELCNILEGKYNISLPKEIVPKMSVGQLRNIQAQVVDNKEQAEGLEGYFTRIIPNELLASAELVLMPTLIHKSVMRSDEFDGNETYLCIIPGLEGHHERFALLCERLKIAAVVLQYGLENFRETIHEMAQRLVDVMTKKIKIKKRFYLLGYEFGLIVALEMAAILESYGFTGTVYCLGGSPNDIQATLQTKLGVMTDEALQNEIIYHINWLLSGYKNVEMQSQLQEVKTFSDKIELCVENLRGRVHFTTQYIKALIETAYARIVLTHQYNRELGPKHAKIILLRAILPIQPTDFFAAATHDLVASLTHAPQDLRCPAIINKYLDIDILEAFDRKNHCDTFLLNNDLYMKFGVED